MQQVIRLSLTLFMAGTLGSIALPKTEMTAAAYKRSDASFYWTGDVQKADPAAVILPESRFAIKDGVYTLTPQKKAPKEIYVEVVQDWVEPITPPDMPASLGVPPDAMQIREPQGDVQAAFPSAPTTFLPVTSGMTIPNGTVVRTGGNGSAAVLFGGVNSARLIPNSEAAMQQTVTGLSRSTEIDLTKGAVFSKVGQRMGEKQDYQVHTPFGVAAARGTDFVTITMSTRTDVWIAQGTVQLTSPEGKMVGQAKSDGAGALKIIRFPVMADVHQAMLADAETMTEAMNFIPLVNLKIKGLKDKIAQKVQLSPNELNYLGRIKKVPCLIKVSLVEPASAPMPTPSVTAPATLAPVPAATPTAAIDLDLRTDGKVDFQGATLTMAELKAKLEMIGRTSPEQSITIKPANKTEQKAIKKVQGLCATAKLRKVTVDNSLADKAAADKATVDKIAANKAKADQAVKDKAAKDKAAADKVVADKAAADKAAADKMAADKAKADQAAKDKAAADKMTADKAAADKLAAQAKLPPMEIGVHADGMVDFQGATLTQDALKLKLADLAKTTPGQPLVILKRDKVFFRGGPRKVAELCRAASFKNVTVSKAPPALLPAPVAPVVPAPATNAPAASVPPPVPAKQLPPAMQLPLNLQLRPDGRVKFEDSTLSLLQLKEKLEELATTTPDQEVVIKRAAKTSPKQVDKVVRICHAAQFEKVTVVKAEKEEDLLAANGVTSKTSLSTDSPSLAEPAADDAPAAPVSPLRARNRLKSDFHPSAAIATGPNDTVP